MVTKYTCTYPVAKKVKNSAVADPEVETLGVLDKMNTHTHNEFFVYSSHACFRGWLASCNDICACKRAVCL